MAECWINEPHCSLCGATDVANRNDGYSSCCNKRMTNQFNCQYPFNHDHQCR
jgi:hypothetical protein